MVDPKEKFEEGKSINFVSLEIDLFRGFANSSLQSAKSPRAARQ